jgi:hypothetical protein
MSAASLARNMKPKEVIKLALAFDRAGVCDPSLFFAVLQSGMNLRNLTPDELASLLCLYTSTLPPPMQRPLLHILQGACNHSTVRPLTIPRNWEH